MLRSTPNSVFNFRMMFLKAVPASLPFRLALDSTSSAPALCSTVRPMAEAAEPTTLKLCESSPISAAPYLLPAASTLITRSASLADNPNWLIVPARDVAAASMVIPEACANVTLFACKLFKPDIPIVATSIWLARIEYARAAVSAPRPESFPSLRAFSLSASRSSPRIPVIELRSAIDCPKDIPP